MEYIISLFTMGTELFCFCLVLCAIHPTKPRTIVWACSLCLVFVLQYLLIGVLFREKFTSIGKLLLVCLLLYFIATLLFGGNPYHNLGITCFFMAAMYGMDYLVLMVLLVLTNVSLPDFLLHQSYYILCTFIAKTLLFLFCYCFYRFYQTGAQPTQNQWWELARILVVPTFTIGNLWMVVDAAIKHDDITIWVAIDAVALFIANVILFFLFDYATMQQQAKQENALLKQTIQANAEQHQVLMDGYANQRALTHDYRNHLSTILGLIEQDNFQTAKSYVAEELQKEERNIRLDTNHPVIDTLLSQKYQKAKQLGISMRFSANDLSAFPLTNGELVTILGNLLDNAIEACQKQERSPQIYLSLSVQCQQAMIYLENTVSPDFEMEQLEHSDKVDALNHGYGLRNIKKMIAMKHGVFTCEQEDSALKMCAFFSAKI